MPGSDTRQTSTTTTLRLTPADRAALDQRAAAERVGPSTLARRVVLDYLGQPHPQKRRRPTASDELLREVLAELGHIGNNLNQLARVANSSGLVDLAGVDRCQRQLADLTKLVLA